MIASYFVNAVPIAVSLVFLTSVASKLQDPRGFLEGVVTYRVLPSQLAVIYGIVLIPLEGFVALSLITGLWLRIGSIVGLLLLTSFFIAVAINVGRHRTLPCYCFGSASGERISSRSLARIAILIVGMLVTQQLERGDMALIPTIGRGPEDGLVELTLAVFLLIAGTWVLHTQDLLLLYEGASRASD